MCVARQTNGFTPLYIASQDGHVEAVTALIGAGAAVNQATVRDDLDGHWCLFQFLWFQSVCSFPPTSLCLWGLRGLGDYSGHAAP